VREPFWRTLVEVAKTNPGSLRCIVMFSKRVIGEIDRRMAELDAMLPAIIAGAERALPPAAV
jgi:hypothetical protein